MAKITEGEKRNPKGKQDTSDPKKKFTSQLNIRELLAGGVTEILTNPIKNVDEVLSDPEAPALVACVAKTVQTAYKTGDFQRYIEPILCRLLGKPKEASIDEKDGLSNLPLEDLMKLVHTASKYIVEHKKTL